MNKPPTLKPDQNIVVCAECGAENKLPAGRCWLCYRPLSGAPDVITAEVVGHPPARKIDKTSQIVFGVMTVGVFGLVLLVGIGMAVNERDLLLPVAVVISPALIATGISLLRSSHSEQGLSWQRAFLTMIASFGITMGVLALLVVALFVTLFLMCLHAIAPK